MRAQSRGGISATALCHRPDLWIWLRARAGASRAMPALRLALDDLLLQLAQAVDAESHHVAGFEEYGHGLHAEPDTGRRAGDDDVAGLHDEILRTSPDDVPAVEDHGRGIAALAFFAVDVKPHGELLRVLD